VENTELFPLAVAFILAIKGFGTGSSLVREAGLKSTEFPRRWFGRVLILCAVLFAVVLHFWSAPSIRFSQGYFAYYLVFNLFFLGGTFMLLPALGYSIAADVVEHGNRAVVVLLSLATLALTTCIAAANIGDGPGVYVVALSAVAGVVTLYVFWALLELVSGAFNDRITVEHDVGAALRLGGLLLGAALLIGSAVAGDWVGEDELFSALRAVTLPLIALLFLGALLERFAGDRLAGKLGAALLSATGYVLVPAAYVVPWR